MRASLPQHLGPARILVWGRAGVVEAAGSQLGASQLIDHSQLLAPQVAAQGYSKVEVKANLGDIDADTLRQGYARLESGQAISKLVLERWITNNLHRFHLGRDLDVAIKEISILPITIDKASRGIVISCTVIETQEILVQKLTRLSHSGDWGNSRNCLRYFLSALALPAQRWAKGASISGQPLV